MTTTSTPTSELVNQATAQIATLVRDELALARTELAEKGKRAGLGGGLVGAAVVLAPLPEQAIGAVEADVRAVTDAAREGRRS